MEPTQITTTVLRARIVERWIVAMATTTSPRTFGLLRDPHSNVIEAFGLEAPALGGALLLLVDGRAKPTPALTGEGRLLAVVAHSATLEEKRQSSVGRDAIVAGLKEGMKELLKGVATSFLPGSEAIVEMAAKTAELLRSGSSASVARLEKAIAASKLPIVAIVTSFDRVAVDDPPSLALAQRLHANPGTLGKALIIGVGSSDGVEAIRLTRRIQGSSSAVVPGVFASIEYGDAEDALRVAVGAAADATVDPVLADWVFDVASGSLSLLLATCESLAQHELLKMDMGTIVPTLAIVRRGQAFGGPLLRHCSENNVLRQQFTQLFERAAPTPVEQWLLHAISLLNVDATVENVLAAVGTEPKGWLKDLAARGIIIEDAGVLRITSPTVAHAARVTFGAHNPQAAMTVATFIVGLAQRPLTSLQPRRDNDNKPMRGAHIDDRSATRATAKATDSRLFELSGERLAAVRSFCGAVEETFASVGDSDAFVRFAHGERILIDVTAWRDRCADGQLSGIDLREAEALLAIAECLGSSAMGRFDLAAAAMTRAISSSLHAPALWAKAFCALVDMHLGAGDMASASRLILATLQGAPRVLIDQVITSLQVPDRPDLAVWLTSLGISFDTLPGIRQQRIDALLRDADGVLDLASVGAYERDDWLSLLDRGQALDAIEQTVNAIVRDFDGTFLQLLDETDDEEALLDVTLPTVATTLASLFDDLLTASAPWTSLLRKVGAARAWTFARLRDALDEEDSDGDDEREAVAQLLSGPLARPAVYAALRENQAELAGAHGATEVAVKLAFVADDWRAALKDAMARDDIDGRDLLVVLIAGVWIANERDDADDDEFAQRVREVARLGETMLDALAALPGIDGWDLSDIAHNVAGTLEAASSMLPEVKTAAKRVAKKAAEWTLHAEAAAWDEGEDDTLREVEVVLAASDAPLPLTTVLHEALRMMSAARTTEDDEEGRRFARAAVSILQGEQAIWFGLGDDVLLELRDLLDDADARASIELAAKTGQVERECELLREFAETEADHLAAVGRALDAENLVLFQRALDYLPEDYDDNDIRNEEASLRVSINALLATRAASVAAMRGESIVAGWREPEIPELNPDDLIPVDIDLGSVSVKQARQDENQQQALASVLGLSLRAVRGRLKKAHGGMRLRTLFPELKDAGSSQVKPKSKAPPQVPTAVTWDAILQSTVAALDRRLVPILATVLGFDGSSGVTRRLNEAAPQARVKTVMANRLAQTDLLNLHVRQLAACDVIANVASQLALTEEAILRRIAAVGPDVTLRDALAERCRQCGKVYLNSENNGDVCRFHPGVLFDYDRVGLEKFSKYSIGGAGGDFWDCCKQQVDTDGFVEGCARGPHRPEVPEGVLG